MAGFFFRDGALVVGTRRHRGATGVVGRVPPCLLGDATSHQGKVGRRNVGNKTQHRGESRSPSLETWRGGAPSLPSKNTLPGTRLPWLGAAFQRQNRMVRMDNGLSGCLQVNNPLG